MSRSTHLIRLAAAVAAATFTATGAGYAQDIKLGFAGAPMHAALLLRLQQAFRPKLFVNHYGSSEINTFSINQNAVGKPGSAGRAGMNTRLRVIRLAARSPDDRGADQSAGLVLIAFEHGLGGGAFEYRLPELPPRASRGQPLGDRSTELGGKLGQRIEPRMQLLLEPGTQALGQHRRCARGSDGNGDLAAVDNGRQREGAKLGAIRDVHRHTEGARDGRYAGIFLIVFGAILSFAVHWSVAGLDLQAVGWILMLAGFAGLVLFFVFWNRRRTPRTIVTEQRVPRTTVVSERRYRDDVPPV